MLRFPRGSRVWSVQGNSVPHGKADCYGVTKSIEVRAYPPSSCTKPPTRRTLPSGRRVAEWCFRGSESSGPGDHEFVAGSNISVVELMLESSPTGCTPPAASTLPSGRSVSEWSTLGLDRSLVGVHVPATGVVYFGFAG